MQHTIYDQYSSLHTMTNIKKIKTLLRSNSSIR